MANQWVKVDGKAYDTAFQRLRDGMDDLAEVLSPVLVKQLEDLKYQHRCNNCGQNSQMFHPSRGGFLTKAVLETMDAAGVKATQRLDNE